MFDHHSHKPLRSSLLIWVLIVAHISAIMGCTSTHESTLIGGERPVAQNMKVVRVILKSGEIVQFDKSGGRYAEKIKDSKMYLAILGLTESFREVEIPAEDALEVKIETSEPNSAGSFLGGLLLGMGVGALGFYLFLVAAFSGR